MLTGRIRLAAAALILAPALLYLGLEDASQQPFNARPSDPVLQQSDYYIIKGRISDYASDGSMKQRLNAEQLEHQPQSEQLLAVSPQLRIFSANKAPIDISSLTGVMSDNSNIINLNGQVLIQDTPQQSQSVTVETESLQIFPNKKFAQTDSKVTLSNSTGVTTGIGMKAYFDSRTIELLSQVKGSYNAN
ncbi:MAG: LPS export ABC transporter periplasmic protein LptC [Amphritea sp.]